MAVRTVTRDTPYSSVMSASRGSRVPGGNSPPMMRARRVSASWRPSVTPPDRILRDGSAAAFTFHVPSAPSTAASILEGTR